MDGTLGWHVMMRLADGRVIARDAAARRRLARVVLSMGRPVGLLVFRVADTHLHAVLTGNRGTVGRFCQRVGASLRQRLALPVPFAPAHCVAVRDQVHLRNTFRYVLAQESHHGIAADLLHDGSNLPDLLGLRLVGAYTIDGVRRHLPRVARADLVEHLPVQPREEEGLPRLGDAVDAVAADATGLERTAVLAAGAHAAGNAARADGVALALGVSPRSVQRWRTETPNPALVRAVRLQLGLRRALGDRVG